MLPYDHNRPVQGYGSTDVGDVSYCCPTVQFTGTTQAYGTPGHSWQLSGQSGSPVGHRGMIHAAEVMALTAVMAAEDPAKLTEAKAEYDKVIGHYDCPVGPDAKPQL